MLRDLREYQEAVWDVVEYAISLENNIERAIAESKVFGSVSVNTKSEILDYANATELEFNSDCYKYFGKVMASMLNEMTNRAEFRELQVARLKGLLEKHDLLEETEEQQLKLEWRQRQLAKLKGSLKKSDDLEKDEKQFK